MEARHAVLLVLFGFSVIIGTNGLCDTLSEMQKCALILSPRANLTANDGNQSSWKREELEFACRRLADEMQNNLLIYRTFWPKGLDTKMTTFCIETQLDKFLSCYDSSIEKCNDEAFSRGRLIYAKTFGYICEKGLELYLKTMDCLNQEPTRTESAMCFASHDFSLTKKEAPDKIDAFSKCMKKAAGPCGEDGQKYVDGFIGSVGSGSNHPGNLSYGMITAIVCAVAVTVVLIAGF